MKSKLSKYTSIIMWIGVLIYGGLCFYLFYMQSIQPLDYNNRYFQSDLPYHISMIIDDGWYYSFTAYAYQLFYWLGGKGTVLIALFLAAASVLCVFLTEKLLELLLGRSRADALTVGCALALNLVMPFFWRFAGEYRYVSYQAGNIWHNSTYQCMKPVALAAMIYYMKTEKDYRESLSGRQWLGLAGLLVLCTGIKPSFLTVFAPVLAVKLLADLCRKVPFKQVFLLGSTVIPACGVILWQNMIQRVRIRKQKGNSGQKARIRKRKGTLGQRSRIRKRKKVLGQRSRIRKQKRISGQRNKMSERNRKIMRMKVSGRMRQR